MGTVLAFPTAAERERAARVQELRARHLADLMRRWDFTREEAEEVIQEVVADDEAARRRADRAGKGRA